jgi:hypothetical protein
MNPRWLALAGILAVAMPHTARTQQVAPAAGPVSIVTVGGTSVVAVTGPVRGCYITNPSTATDQGIAGAESAYVDPTKAATLVGNGSNAGLDLGQSWSCPPMMAPGSSVWVNAATSGHKFVVVVW